MIVPGGSGDKAAAQRASDMIGDAFDRAVPRGTDHQGGPLVMEKDVQARAEDNDGTRPQAVYIDRAIFMLAVQACLNAALNGRSPTPDGAPTKLYPTPFRMATEVREALRRACDPFEIEVQGGWGVELIREIRLPFPGEATNG